MFTKEDIGKKVYIHCELSDRVIGFFPDRTGIIVGVDDKFFGAEVNVKTPGGHCWGFSHNDLRLLPEEPKMTATSVGAPPGFYFLLEETVASISQFEADRQEAIQNHRKLWNWLADNPYIHGRLTEKWQYPLFRQNIDEISESQCYLCEFAAQRVLEDDDNMESSYCLDDCIIKWPGENGCHSSISNQSLFSMWQSTNDPGWRAGLARAIAELPENPDMLESV